MPNFQNYVKKKVQGVRELGASLAVPSQPRTTSSAISPGESAAQSLQDGVAGGIYNQDTPSALQQTGPPPVPQISQFGEHEQLSRTLPPTTQHYGSPEAQVQPASSPQTGLNIIGIPSVASLPSGQPSASPRAPASTQFAQKPQTEAKFINSNISAGRDNNIYTVTGVVNIVKEPTLSRLKTSLHPVSAAAFNSYEGSRERTDCFENTRVKLLSEIEAWMLGGDDQAPIFILDGIAGIGKSTIAQTIATQASARKLLAASFFFSRNEELRKIAKYFFPTVAYQLACYNNTFALRISDALDHEPDAAEQGLSLQFSALILDPLHDLLAQVDTPLLLVIDALDECEEEGGQMLLELLTTFIPQISGLRVLITARPEGHLRQVLESNAGHNIFRLHDIEDSIVKSDIQLYLTYHLSSPKMRRMLPSSSASQWPSADEITQLCDLCGVLFIAASTTVKFIGDPKHSNPQNQLSQLLARTSSSNSSSKHTNAIDQMYLQILLTAIPDDVEEGDADWFLQYKQALGAVIVLETPLSCQTLAALLDTQESNIIAALSHLHSLVAPTFNDSEIIFQLHHKSFPDFITNQPRLAKAAAAVKLGKSSLARHLLIEPADCHYQLAKACLQVMNKELHYNMAGLLQNDWYLDKSEIPHINSSVISRQLKYAAMHWASHILGLQEMDLVLHRLLHTWTTKHILMWFEVMGMLGSVDTCQEMIQAAISSVEKTLKFKKHNIAILTTWLSIKELLGDAWRFILKSAAIIKLSPIHLYWSCITFLPKQTKLYQKYSNVIATKAEGLATSWDNTLITLVGHSQEVKSVAFSPDGLILASASYDKTVRLWDAKSGVALATLTGHTQWVDSIAFSPSGLQLASASRDQTIRLWNPKTGVAVATLTDHSEWVNAVTFSPDGLQFASASRDNTIILWDVKTATALATLTDHSDWVLSVAFSPDSLTLASGSADRTVKLWNAKSGTVIATITGHYDRVNAVIFSPDGLQLASGSRDNTVKLWNTKTGAAVMTLRGHSEWVESVAFSPDGQQLASTSQSKTIRLWDTKSGNALSTLTSHSSMVFTVVFSPDGLRLASASADKTVRLWDIKSGSASALASSTGHSESVYSVAFSPDGLQLASASYDKMVRLWNITTGATIATLTGHSDWVFSAAFSPNGHQLATSSRDKTIQLWDPKSGARLASLTGHYGWVRSVAFSPDGLTLASASHDKTVRLWNAKNGATIAILERHSEWVDLVAFSPDGKLLASASWDETVKLWDAKTGAAHVTLPGHTKVIKSIVFSPDGMPFICVSDKDGAKIWDCHTGNLVTTFPKNQLSIHALSVIPRDSKTLFYKFFPNYQTSSQRTLPVAPSPLSTSFLLLVQHQGANVHGLIAARSQPDADWELVPICWFPTHIQPQCISVDYASSTVAIGCGDGKVIFLDFTTRFTKDLSFLIPK